ncbi:hypothetical protein [Pseudokineococcus lusitanus]|uniref:Uncharacterized protein n=1 Tax=Pseudokineococcus lusitanus TaxID=763993 RepID=A0A3N1HSP8_9ACTN|nr:hypothetical protein [Pseudokineococcus lusitanus]ROP45543.1 hypothetical protein EDC03_0147 [Pseudokineococcus lusitanus]
MPPPTAARPTPHRTGPTRGRWRAVVVGVSAAVGVLCAGGFALLVLQPWRTCPDDDAPAACPMLARDHGLLVACVVVGLVAALGLVLALTTTPRDRQD